MDYRDWRFYVPVYYFVGTIIFLFYFGFGMLQNYIGAVIMFVGYVIWFISRFNLGNKLFVMPVKPKKLIIKGLYKKIRHPLYFAQFIVLVGFLVYVGLWYLWFVLIPYIILQRTRIKKEEEILEKAFGKEYLDYKKQTWF